VSYEFDGIAPKFTEINFILLFIILIHFLETKEGYDVEQLVGILQRSDNTIRMHLRRLGELGLIKKDRPFRSQKDYYIFNPELLRELAGQKVELVRFGSDLKKVLAHLFKASKTHLRGSPPPKKGEG